MMTATVEAMNMDVESAKAVVVSCASGPMMLWTHESDLE